MHSTSVVKLRFYWVHPASARESAMTRTTGTSSNVLTTVCAFYTNSYYAWHRKSCTFFGIASVECALMLQCAMHLPLWSHEMLIYTHTSVLPSSANPTLHMMSDDETAPYAYSHCTGVYVLKGTQTTCSERMWAFSYTSTLLARVRRHMILWRNPQASLSTTGWRPNLPPS
jgi:hypothetical protein